MTNEAFTEAVIRMTPTLYRIARGQLLIEADQQDAVQEAIRRSWEKRNSLKNAVVYGLLTTENLQQAIDRAGGRLGNKGDECAVVAIKMAKF